MIFSLTVFIKSISLLAQDVFKKTTHIVPWIVILIVRIVHLVLLLVICIGTQTLFSQQFHA